MMRARTCWRGWRGALTLAAPRPGPPARVWNKMWRTSSAARSQRYQTERAEYDMTESGRAARVPRRRNRA